MFPFALGAIAGAILILTLAVGIQLVRRSHDQPASKHKSSRICPICHNSLRVGVSYCTTCGAFIANMNYVSQLTQTEKSDRRPDPGVPPTLQNYKDQLVTQSVELSPLSKETGTAVAVGRGLSYLGFQELVTVLTQGIVIAFLARLVGVSAMGLYVVLTTTVVGSQVFINLGMNQVVTKLTAENVAQGRIRAAASLFYLSFLLSVVMSLIVGAVIFVTGFPGGISQVPASRLISTISALLAFDVIVNSIQMSGSSLLGLKKFKVYMNVMSTYAVARGCVIFLFVYLTRSLVGLVAAWATTDLAISVMIVVYLVREFGRPVFGYSPKKLLRLSMPLFFGAICSYLFTWFDRLMLISFANLAALGVYGAATTAFDAYSNLIGVLPNVLVPTFAETHGSAGPDILRSSAKAASRYISYTAMPIAFLLLAAAKPTLALFVGDAYTGGALPLAVLAAFSTSSIIAIVFSPILIVLNLTGLAALSTIISVGIGVVVGYFIIPITGTLGGALARGLAMVVNLILTLVFLRKRFNVRLDFGAIGKSVLASASMVPVVYLIELICYSRFLLPVYCIIAAFVYLLALRALKAATNQDMLLMRKLVGSRLERVVDVLCWLLNPHEE